MCSNVYDGIEERAGCSGCVYADQHLFCVYILVEQKRRGVPVAEGGGCEKKRKGVKKIPCMEDSARYRPNAENVGVFDEEAAMLLYGSGAVDIQIAKALGATREQVAKWRIAENLKSNEITRRAVRSKAWRK